VILIDEPGLYLHAKAQRDILKNLEKAGGTAQVIFSTHSPYLIETDKLERIRLVEKLGEKGTVIQNKIHAASDKETLTPILTAIGLELNQGISNVDRIDNVIVEGASDYYYLNAFREILGAKGPNFISGGGAGNMPFVGTILQGWGCKVVYLYDSDQGYKDATKNLKSKWVTITKEQLSKIPVDGGIEDVFSKNDFLKVVLEEPPAAIEGRNSDYMKGKDKVLTAKRWLEAVRSGKRRELSKETKEAATKLMTNLTEILTKPE
jgi:predicted ATP-dependent endonuclease of OLD family